MSRTIGKITSKAAVFVYKADGTEADAWEAILELRRREGELRGESHAAPEPMLEGLRTWNRAQQDNQYNTFLCIYAHMGSLGVNSVGGNPDTRITWTDLKNALPLRVSNLWLVGCESERCISAWEGNHPIYRYLAVTTESRYFLELLPLFRHEISTHDIVPFDQIPARLRHDNSALAACTRYFRAEGPHLKPAFEP